MVPDALKVCMHSENVFAEYREVEQLQSSGYYGYIFHVKKDSSSFVLKILDKLSVDDKYKTLGSSVTFNDESELHSVCQHPHILHCYHHFESVSFACLVLEMCRGGDLKSRLVHYLTSQVVHPETQPVIAADILLVHMGKAIDYIHTKGIVHRDVKLENMYAEKWHGSTTICKLGDFGLARRALRYAGCRTYCGTLEYLAPEICAAKHAVAAYGQQVDVWSLGISVYEVVTLESPYDDGDCWAQVSRGCITIPDGIPMHMQNLLRRMLDKDPVSRILANELVVALSV